MQVGLISTFRILLSIQSPCIRQFVCTNSISKQLSLCRIHCDSHLLGFTLATHFIISKCRDHRNMCNCHRITIILCNERRQIIGCPCSGKSDGRIAVRPRIRSGTSWRIVRSERHGADCEMVTQLHIGQRIHGSRRVHRDSERLGYTFANHSIVGAVRSHCNGSHSRSIRIIDSLERSNARTGSRSI